MEAKEEVRSRLNIEDVIGQYVSLKRAGRNWKGLSPFTNEKTPSFIVSPDKQIWHDFSSNKGGDVFSFVMEVEGIDFRSALELLARKAGVDLSLYQSAGAKDMAQKRRRLHSILDLATQFYQQSLIRNQHALEYVFKKRGFDKATVEAFKIGYSPQSDDALLSALKKRGFTEKEVQDAGLTSRRRGTIGDMFRGRMMVPLADGQGQVVGFTARIIADVPNAPKYINTPQTLLYDKGRQVFGLHLAKEAIRQADKAVVVEGNLDVVSSHQAGVKNVVAAAGTALTENHLNSLVRLTENIALAFDGDKAGIAATERAIEMAQRVGARLTIVTLPGEAKDPDELIQQDPKLWTRQIDQEQPVVDWLNERYKNLYDNTTA
jgi:DNA primase